MNALVYCWNNSIEKMLINSLKQTNYSVFCCSEPCIHMTKDFNLAQTLFSLIHNNNISFIVSYNFYPIISMVCETANIPYYCWVYDCPHPTVYSKQASHPCNRIGIFDKHMADDLVARGITTCFHLPLASDYTFLDNVVIGRSKDQIRHFSSDISFVGSLYNDTNSEFYKLPIDGTLRQQTYDILSQNSFTSCNLEEVVFAEPLINAWKYAMKESNCVLGDDYIFTLEDILYSCIFPKVITSIERSLLLSGIVSELPECRFHLYTSSPLDEYPMLKSCHKGIVDYNTELPIVYSLSKINLNITLKSITSGIPQRVFDILGCGGFLLSNFQPELSEYFKPDKELVLYNTLEEAIEKAKYYLSHDSIRDRIAQNGYEAVRKRFPYNNQLATLLNR